MKEKKRKAVIIPSMEQVEQERSRLEFRAEGKKSVRNMFLALLVIAAVSVACAVLCFRVIWVSGASKDPALAKGDIVLLERTKELKTRDLCGFYFQNNLLLKRIVGEPGDLLEVDENGKLCVNGQAVEEMTLTERMLEECELQFPFLVPEHRYFVFGEYEGVDFGGPSVVIGSIGTDQIGGRAALRIWPLGKVSFLN